MELLHLSEITQNNIKEYMPSDWALNKLAQYFAVFSDCTRIKIVTALCLSEMCVNDISLSLAINQTTVSHQLKYLKQMGIVDYRRQGKIMFYSVAKKSVNDVMMYGVDYLINL